MKTYITFGQAHKHVINGKTFDRNCVAEIEAENYSEARKKAFEAFGPKFCFAYAEEHFNFDTMIYFPRGIVRLS